MAESKTPHELVKDPDLPPANESELIDAFLIGPAQEPAGGPDALPIQQASSGPDPAIVSPTGDDKGSSFEIEWFDEERKPATGHLFAEPPPEPPLQPFEVIREPKPTAKPTGSGARTGKGGVEAARPGLTVSAHPSIWVRLMWGVMPLFLLVAGYGSVILTQKGTGYAWDEAYYYEPAEKAADWLIEVIRGNQPFDQKTIDEYWGDHHEHPSVQKILSGLAIRAFPDPERHQWAMRLPIAILFGMTLNLLYWLGRRTWGPMSGLIIALIYATMPRIFGHAHLAAMETPMVFMMLLVVFCFLRGLDSPFWALMTGVSFGLLLATKINGFFLPIPLILWGQLYARRRYVNNLFAMLILGPLVFVAAWPWLWPDPVMRLLNYLAFHATHQPTALYFMGQTWGYGQPVAPWFYPLVIVGVTIPLSGLVLIVWGVARTLVGMPRRPIGALYLMCALVMLGVASAPSIPKYDGERLFMPVFPFLALLGGSGMVGLVAMIQRLAAHERRQDPHHQQRVWRWAALGMVLIVLSDGAMAIHNYQPYLLSYFNPLVGGLRGAVEKYGFEATYWGEALNDEVVDEINQLPNGARLKPLALNELCLQHLQLWGRINPDIRIGGEPPFDYHLLLMRRGFFRRPETALADSQRFPVIKEWDKMGVPIIALYQTGAGYEAYLRDLAVRAAAENPTAQGPAAR